jgi:hypothetical protein
MHRIPEDFNLENYGCRNGNYESGTILEADVMGSFRKMALKL